MSIQLRLAAIAALLSGGCTEDPLDDGGRDASCSPEDGCDAGTGRSDAGLDASSAPDAFIADASADAGPVRCAPGSWFCDPTQNETHYCNATGDGVVRTMRCHERACASGFCAPGPAVEWLCGVLANGMIGEVVADCPVMDRNRGNTYGIWLERGDTLRVSATAMSPLIGAEVRIEHPCTPGSIEICESIDVSEPGGTLEAERTAPYRENVRVRVRRVRAEGDPDDVAGARVSFRVELVPPAVVPPLVATCTPGERACSSPEAIRYCSEDGALERDSPCAIPEMPPTTCASGACGSPSGDTCADAPLLVRPSSDELVIEALNMGLNDDYDPGPACFGMGQSGADRVFRLALTAGERIRILERADDNYSPHTIHSVYLLRDCRDPSSCIAGAIGARTPTEMGYDRTFAALSHVAAADETVYLVFDREWREDVILTRREVTISWDGTCDDGVRNGDETGIDCGGPCPRCADGEPCRSSADCVSRRCFAGASGSVCSRPAGCGDGVFGEGEECDDGNSVDDDWCSEACLVPSCTDGLRNGDETAADRGGYCTSAFRETCRRAEVVVPPPGELGAPYASLQIDQTFAGATDDYHPSCAPGPGVDHAYRFVLDRPARMRFENYSNAVDRVATMTVALARDCGGPELACASGDYTASLERVLEPGAYIVWVEENGGADEYALLVDGN